MTPGRVRSVVTAALRSVLGLGLLAALLWYSEPGRIWELFRNASPWLLLWIPLLSLARIWIMAQRFHVLVAPLQPIDRATLARQFLVGAYANNFLPTAIGGDALRIAMLRQEHVSGRLALSLVLLERLIGFAALVALSAAGAFLVDLPAAIRAIVVALALATLLGILIFRALLRAPGQTRWSRLVSPDLRLEGRTLALAFAWSLVLQLFSIGLSWVVGLALGAAVPAGIYLALVPLVWVVTMLPVTIGGVGLREAAFVYLFGSAGVSSEVSLGISLGTWAGLLFSGLLGGIVLARSIASGRAIRLREP